MPAYDRLREAAPYAVGFVHHTTLLTIRPTWVSLRVSCDRKNAVGLDPVHAGEDHKRWRMRANFWIGAACSR